MVELVLVKHSLNLATKPYCNTFSTKKGEVFQFEYLFCNMSYLKSLMISAKWIRRPWRGSRKCEEEVKKRAQAGWSGCRRVSGVICVVDWLEKNGRSDL